MRVVLKKEKARPKAPKTATLKSIANYEAKLKAVKKYNDGVRAYNRSLVAKANSVQKTVAGFKK